MIFKSELIVGGVCKFGYSGNGKVVLFGSLSDFAVKVGYGGSNGLTCTEELSRGKELSSIMRVCFGVKGATLERRCRREG